MTDYTLPTSASVLDIRAAYALAKVYRRFDLGEHEAMLGAAMTAAERYPWHAQLVEDQMTTCPALFADEPTLVACWDAGVAEHPRCCLPMNRSWRRHGCAAWCANARQRHGAARICAILKRPSYASSARK
jgi:hypothetical protein